jgi:hypothetical protein
MADSGDYVASDIGATRSAAGYAPRACRSRIARTSSGTRARGSRPTTRRPRSRASSRRPKRSATKIPAKVPQRPGCVGGAQSLACKSLIGFLPAERFELPTNGLQNRCSTTELSRHRHGRRGRRPNPECQFYLTPGASSTPDRPPIQASTAPSAPRASPATSDTPHVPPAARCKSDLA